MFLNLHQTDAGVLCYQKLEAVVSSFVFIISPVALLDMLACFVLQSMDGVEAIDPAIRGVQLL